MYDFDFSGAQAYLIGTINETISRREPYRLERMRVFLRELGDPQKAYPTVQIGGTSGKGSTATMAAAALAASGRRTGLHTKPHLRSMTERARIDGAAISEERFAETLSAMMPAIERTAAQFGRPSYYETLLALAFTHFAQERVDIAVIEVGLGGRLDGTNVIVPEVCAITSVGFDHMDVLGETIEAIAREKAGIIKPGVPVVTAVTDPQALAVIEEEARVTGAALIRVDESARIDALPGERFGQSFRVVTKRASYDLFMPVLGIFQRRNAATAILALEALPDTLRPDADAVERGLAGVAIPGRMEVFPGHPTLVFDIAHNAEKAANLVASLAETFPQRRFTFVVAIGESKDAQQIIVQLASVPANFVFTTFAAAGRESTKPQRLASIAETVGAWGRSIADPIEALAVARRNVPAGDVVVVTGSTFIVAELREWWVENVGHARAFLA
jgi:dihydrofolate synthase/folylpolyglutamate synthase